MDKEGFIKAYEMLKIRGIIKRQKDVAELTDSDESVVSNYLSGRVEPSRNFLEKFSKVFKDDLIKLDNGNGLKKYGTPYLGELDIFAGKQDIEHADLSEFITGYISIPGFRDATYYVNVRGNSMYGRYVAGDIIAIKLVRDKTEIQYGQVYVVVTDENRVIKYVRKGSDEKVLKLVSENPKFDDYEVERKKVKAMFLVLGKISKDVL